MLFYVFSSFFFFFVCLFLVYSLTFLLFQFFIGFLLCLPCFSGSLGFVVVFLRWGFLLGFLFSLFIYYLIFVFFVLFCCVVFFGDLFWGYSRFTLSLIDFFFLVLVAVFGFWFFFGWVVFL